MTWSFTIVLALLHGLAIWIGMGGRDGLTSPWPLAHHDHPLYFHSAVITRHFLQASWTTAGYDPSFMAGYPKSIIFPASSTLPEVVVALFGSTHPVQAYKACVLVSVTLAPWLLAGACLAWGLGSEGVCVSVLVFLLYLWTDFPINYATFGMVPYFVDIPLGLLVTAALTRFFRRGGAWWWLASAVGSALVVLVHLTGAMIVAPAAALAYAVAMLDSRRAGRPFPASRHAGVWAIPAVVLAANAFWWLPGIWLASTKGPSDFAFAHPESVWGRLAKIATVEPPIQAVLCALVLPGLLVLARRDRVSAAGLAGFLGAGFSWGYLAGFSRSLDFLQPGRHTYAFYTAASLAAGVAWAEVQARLGAGRVRLATWAALGLLLVGLRIFGPAVDANVRSRLAGPEPFLSSRPSPQLRWVRDQVLRHVRPGERLLYEEGGFDLPGVPDPFAGGRYSGLLPYLTGVEVLGGPYLHASLTTNFTQFGEGKLFGQARWGRDHFVRYARLYRPSAILCWSPWALAFCRANPDLIRPLGSLDLGGAGTLWIGRVVGYEGETIRGRARVEAKPGGLRVLAESAELDGSVVLRYHSVPYLRSRPPVRLEAVPLEGDPVPFIGLRPTEGPLTLEMAPPP